MVAAEITRQWEIFLSLREGKGSFWRWTLTWVILFLYWRLWLPVQLSEQAINFSWLESSTKQNHSTKWLDVMMVTGKDASIKTGTLTLSLPNSNLVMWNVGLCNRVWLCSAWSLHGYKVWGRVQKIPSQCIACGRVRCSYRLCIKRKLGTAPCLLLKGCMVTQEEWNGQRGQVSLFSLPHPEWDWCTGVSMLRSGKGYSSECAP